MLYLSYIMIGIIGGFIGGFLGLGGGIIFVPFLFIVFNHFNVNAELDIQSAIITSLACVVLTSLAALLKHQKNNLVVWKIFYKTLPGIVAGSTFGLVCISFISSEYVKIIYGFLLILIATYMLNKKDNLSVQAIKELSHVKKTSFFIGMISSFLGVGGGTMTTPYFNYHGMAIKKCIATAAACGVALSSLGLIISWTLNNYLLNIENDIFKLIVVDAFIIVALSSMLSAYYGAEMTHTFNTRKIKLIFSYFVLIIAFFVIVY